MPNYNESSVAGTKWQRCHEVRISNPFGGAPVAIFNEEAVVAVDGAEVIRRSLGACSAAFDAAAGSIPLVNPMTGELTGTSVSHADLYVILHSLYLQTAAARDAAPEPPGGWRYLGG